METDKRKTRLCLSPMLLHALLTAASAPSYTSLLVHSCLAAAHESNSTGPAPASLLLGVLTASSHRLNTPVTAGPSPAPPVSGPTLASVGLTGVPEPTNSGCKVRLAAKGTGGNYPIEESARSVCEKYIHTTVKGDHERYLDENVPVSPAAGTAQAQGQSRAAQQQFHLFSEASCTQ